MDLALGMLKMFGNNRRVKKMVMRRMQGKIFKELQHSFYNRMKKADYQGGFSFPVTSDTLLLYIHIPFCSSICKNCKFTRTTDLSLIDGYVEALLKDIEGRLASADLDGKRVRACYFGGGTPSLLSGGALKRIIRALRGTYPFDDDTQITIEASPDSLTAEFAAACRELAVDRISIGGQAFNSQVLKQMKRTHSASQLEKAVSLVLKEGLGCNMDFLYGWPSQTADEFTADLKRGIDLGITHFAFYSLTPGLPGKSYSRDDSMAERQKEMYAAGREFMLSRKYTQYTFEHFTKNERCLYSTGLCLYPAPDVIAFGPGTYGWTGNLGYVVRSTVKEYMDTIERGELPLHYYEASEEHRLLNRLFLSLNLLKVDLDLFKGEIEKCRTCKRLIGLLEYLDIIKVSGSRLIINEDYYFTLSAIMSDMVFNVVL